MTVIKATLIFKKTLLNLETYLMLFLRLGVQAQHFMKLHEM